MEKFDEVLADAIAKRVKNLAWFSEGDVQSEIYSTLMKNEELNKLIPTKVSIGKNGNNMLSETTYDTNCLHREYGIENFPNSRCDLVVFDECDIKNITDLINLKNNNDYLKPKYMIEFGTEKSARTPALFQEHITNDIKKVKEAKKIGYIVHIQRAYDEDYKEYCEVLNNLDLTDEKVKVVFLWATIGSDKKRITKSGKIKLYYKDEKVFKGVNQKDLSQKILEIL